MRALRNHGDIVPEVRQWGLGLLANLSSGDADCKQAVADNGGAAALAQLMVAHPDDLRLQQICCGALAHIAQDDEARAALPLPLALTLTLTLTLALALALALTLAPNP